VLITVLYRLLSILALPLILLYLLRRGLGDRRYWVHLRERFGGSPASLDATVPGGIWLHAVSVGEVLSAAELLRSLRVAFPHQHLYLSVTTVAARQIAEQRLAPLADAVFYAPLDFVWAVRRVHRRLRPQLLIVLETEIWPNLFRETKRFGCGLLVVNGRISDRAFPSYQRFAWFFRYVLQWPDAILVQNQQAVERYTALGAPSQRVKLAGNLKYDFRTDEQAIPPLVEEWLGAMRPERIWIAASTMPPAEAGDPDEDDVVIDAIGKLDRLHPGLLTILVPRRPERFDGAARKLTEAGVRFVRRSELAAQPVGSPPALPCTLLLDSMGELTSLFRKADAVFVGGTLPRRGGHNILEPALFGKPVVIGPHMENFPDIAAEFRAAGAVCEVAEPSGLAFAIDGLLRDPNERRRLGEKGRAVAEARRGATALAVAQARTIYSEAVPTGVPTPVETALLGPLTYLWRLGVRFDRRRKQQAGEGSGIRLQTPVISVGGLGMGGTGKTPVTAWLAERLREAGLRPAILTRGYSRANADRPIIAGPGERVSVSETGDEAQILLRRGDAIVGIGADRVSLGREIEASRNADVFLLDDGFQHWRLGREVDLVLIDAFDPLAGGSVFPLGRLRETVDAVQRASACIVTRVNKPVPWVGLERLLRQQRPDLPVFYSRIRPVEWIALDGSQRFDVASLPEGRCGAFCGIGNPASFWASLELLGIRPHFRWAFDDHHHYLPAELQRLADQARQGPVSYLLTTEKDCMNLPESAAAILGYVPVLWLRTTVEMDDEAVFLNWLRKKLQPVSSTSQARGPVY
jgi:tetraacyldisaccharide 4'-kinase